MQTRHICNQFSEADCYLLFIYEKMIQYAFASQFVEVNNF